jgi:hypothetical protein
MENLMRKHEYAQQVRQINSTSGYFHRFYELSGECRTHQSTQLIIAFEKRKVIIWT